MDIKVVRNVLEENQVSAQKVRDRLRERRQTLVNFMSSPGSGKTRLLETLIPILKERGLRVGVIEGDIATARDADRLKHLDIPIALINTEFFGGECHLAANVVLGALEAIDGPPMDLCLLENVGNLVCPAEFDTGSDLNVVLLSVTEGEDKPVKYPLMFRNSHLALVNKIDLAEVVEADVPLLRRNLQQVNPSLEIFETSAKTGLGLAEVADRLCRLHDAKRG
ncbi:MAG: hydrogenase nickel incorporation protein HypB [Oligoflexia bacterium]|nr:hydrogenase nickel incorporation protein HypB [Oligoflexia bacterium]